MLDIINIIDGRGLMNSTAASLQKQMTECQSGSLIAVYESVIGCNRLNQSRGLLGNCTIVPGIRPPDR